MIGKKRELDCQVYRFEQRFKMMKICDGQPLERNVNLVTYRCTTGEFIQQIKPQNLAHKKRTEKLQLKTTPQFDQKVRNYVIMQRNEEAQKLQKQMEAEAVIKREEEARMMAAAKAKEEEQKKIQQKLALEVEAKRKAELKAKQEQEELKAQQDKENLAKIEAQKIAQLKAAQAAQIAKPILSNPNLQQGIAKDVLCDQNKKLIEFWKKLLLSVQQKQKQANILDQPVRVMTEDGPVSLNSVEDTIVRTVNTFYKCEAGVDPIIRDAKMQEYANNLVNRLVEFNQKFRNRPEVFEYAIFKTQESLVQIKCKAPILNPDSTKIKEYVIDFIVNIYDRVAAALPQAGFKEIIIGFCCFRNRLFCPMFPDPNMTEQERLDVVGFRVVGGKREQIEETTKRLKLLSVFFAAMHYSDSYIGRLFLLLECYLTMEYHQNISQIVYHFLEVCGEKMKQTFGRQFTQLLNRYKTQYIPGCQQYIARREMHKEPQNHPKFMKDDFDDMHDTGIHQSNQYLERLKGRINELQ